MKTEVGFRKVIAVSPITELLAWRCQCGTWALSPSGADCKDLQRALRRANPQPTNAITTKTREFGSGTVISTSQLTNCSS
jgi:hypothetical protein